MDGWMDGQTGRTIHRHAEIYASGAARFPNRLSQRTADIMSLPTPAQTDVRIIEKVLTAGAF